MIWGSGKRWVRALVRAREWIGREGMVGGRKKGNSARQSEVRLGADGTSEEGVNTRMGCPAGKAAPERARLGARGIMSCPLIKVSLDSRPKKLDGGTGGWRPRM